REVTGSLVASLAVTGLFVLTESMPLRLEFRKQTWLVSMAEIPMVLGLFTLGPRTLLLCRLVAALAVFALRRSFVLEKQAFNVVLFSLEVGIAGAVFRALGHEEATDPRSWLAAQAAILAFVVVGSVCVYVVIALTHGVPSLRQTIAAIVQALALPPISCGLGLVLILLLSVNPWAVLLAAAMFLVAVAGYRAYADVLRQ